MTRYVGEVVGRWLRAGKHNEPDINRLCVLPDDDASLEAHRTPDDMPPDPAVGVWRFDFDEKTAEQLQADPDFVVLWIEAVREDEAAGPGDVVRAPESRLHNEAALDAAAADVAGAWRDLWQDDMDMLAGGEAERAPGIEPDAVEKKPPDVVPPANERAALTTRLVALGLRGTDLASIITAQNARGEAAEKLKELCKQFPKAKV